MQDKLMPESDMFKGSLFSRSNLSTGELAGGFLLKAWGGFLYLFYFVESPDSFLETTKEIGGKDSGVAR
jgi:hypothetical protein